MDHFTTNTNSQVLFRRDKEGMTPTLIASEQGHLEGKKFNTLPRERAEEQTDRVTFSMNF